MSGRVLVVRPDAMGDVLVSGPAVRAMATTADHLILLAGPRGTAAAHLLPGVDEVWTWASPWIEPEPGAVDCADVRDLAAAIAAAHVDRAVVLTSFHQSALPTALVLRLAGVGHVTAISEDYPGSLLDVRVAPPGEVPEPVRALAVAEAAGGRLPADDTCRLRVDETLLPDLPPPLGDGSRYVVVHPGTSAPARACPPSVLREACRLLAADGRCVVVTGAPHERDLTAHVAGAHACDLGGRLDLPTLAAVLRDAEVVVVANTGPAHLAAAVGTPVVSLFAPTVPAARWAPYAVPVVLLGDQHALCRASRATVCPVPGHPCLSHLTAHDVVTAVSTLSARAPRPAPART